MTNTTIVLVPKSNGTAKLPICCVVWYLFSPIRVPKVGSKCGKINQNFRYTNIAEIWFYFKGFVLKPLFLCLGNTGQEISLRINQPLPD